MTLEEAMAYRREDEISLAQALDVRPGDVKRWRRRWTYGRET